MLYNHIFPNGLTLLGNSLEHFQSVSFTFTVSAGSVRDPRGRYGLSSLLCEMMTRGAGDRTSREFLEEIDRLGIDRSETVYESNTEYRGTLLAENFVPTLELYADYIRRPLLPRNELEAGRATLLQEICSTFDDPEDRFTTQMREHFWGSAWGHDPDGTRNAVKNATWTDILQHYDRFYRPNATVLAVAGNFDWDETVAQVERLFGDWEPKELPDLPKFGTRWKNFHTPFDGQQTQIGLAWETVPFSHPDRLKAWAALGVLGDGMNSRLFDEVREKRGLCYSIGVSIRSFRDRAEATCYAASRAENAQTTLDIILHEVQKLRKGITPEELRAYKIRCRTSLIMDQESTLSTAINLAGDWLHLDRVRPLEEILKRLEDLTVEDVNTYVATHPIPKFILGTLGREGLQVSESLV